MTISVSQATSFASAAGFSGSALSTIVAIAQAESGLNPAAQHPVPNTGTDRGILQINSYWHPEVSDACAYDPACAFRAGYTISNGGRSFTAWSTYNNGSYKQFLGSSNVAGSAWYSFPYGLLFGQGDVGIGGEHGTDIATPLDTPITAIASGTITDIGYQPWGGQITMKTDNPSALHGIPYNYYIHFDALNPGLKVGSHVNVGDFLGYSGGQTTSGGPSLPPGYAHHPTTSYWSSGPHIEWGLDYGPVYGSGAGWVSPASHPELNPKFYLDTVRASGVPSGGGGTGLTGGVPTGLTGGFSLNPADWASGIVQGAISAVENITGYDPGARLNVAFNSFSDQLHTDLVDNPNFYGICLAINDAEQFPGIYNGFTEGGSTDLNPLDIPENILATIIGTIVQNTMPLFVRGLFIAAGVIIIWALMLRLVVESAAQFAEPIAKTAGSFL